MPIELDVGRIRELSRSGRYREALAAAQALATELPQHRDALYLVAANLRCLNRVPEALIALERLEQHHPLFSLLHQERGHCYVALRDAPRAIESFLRAVDINPALIASWMVLERLYGMAGERINAAMAAEYIAMLKQLPSEVVRAGNLFSDGDFATAETILSVYLRAGGEHCEALRLLARIEHQRDMLADAELLIEAALRLAPNYRAARLDYARVLIDQQKYLQARGQIENLLSLEPDNRCYLSLYATACVGLGQHEPAIEIYRRLIEASAGSGELHVALGHSLKAVGQQKDATESYQAATVIRPSFGDAWWSLANLKTYRFSEGEIARMRAEEDAAAVSPGDRCHLCFALGKALEDRKEFAESWQFYLQGNALRRAESRYRPEITETITRRQVHACTAEFFAARAGFGVSHTGPIFIVGLPRSGSTLVEQILASHSQVEGTEELADIQRIVLELGSRSSDPVAAHTADPEYPSYPSVLAMLEPEDFCQLGERYMNDTRAYRGGSPFFIDKMPNNFRHVGLIHLMLPNAKIIDVRREPMACCFGNLKQLFARGQEFTYSVEDIARYYRTYLDLMQHWDAVLPGRVLRVWYEDVVDDLDGNVRRILEYCGLEFEPACMEFYKTGRSVRTPSSEQVRQPIFREGLFQWRNYEPWLGALNQALGDAQTRYRD